jgi:hypothetical protein
LPVHRRLRLLAFPTRSGDASAPDGQEISRFPRRELGHTRGSQTTPGRAVLALLFATVRFAFRHRDIVGARDDESFAARWLAYASPCRRFAADLAIDGAPLGAGAARFPSP